MEIIDISLEIKPDMITYPGNPPPRIEPYAHIPEDRTNESRTIMGTHTGTHVDAFQHVRSVKKYHAAHDVHEKLIENLALIEGLYLKNVSPDNYLLSAFPLKINSDGAPLRAVLIS